jgi:hypothetical protein
MCSETNICLVEEYYWMNKKCKKSWICPFGAFIVVGFSAACTTFGIIGMFKDYSPAQGYTILFLVGMMGDSVVIVTTIIYLLGCSLSPYYRLPINIADVSPIASAASSVSGSAKLNIKIRMADSSFPIEVDSPIERALAHHSPKRAGGASPQRKRSASQ